MWGRRSALKPQPADFEISAERGTMGLLEPNGGAHSSLDTFRESHPTVDRSATIEGLAGQDSRGRHLL